MLNTPVRKGVILAAGLGTRMGSFTQGQPKVLLEFGGQPLILYAIRALVQAGIEEIAVVVGHQAQTIRDVLGCETDIGTNLEYLYNPYFRGGNALSVLMARDWIEDEPFVLCMGDHVMESRLISRLLHAEAIQETLCVDRVPKYCADIDEATKVQTDPSGNIERIGKRLSEWDAIDTGAFLLTDRFIKTAADRISQEGMGLGISEIVQNTIDSGRRFVTCDVTGLFWADMDTKEDIQSVLSGGGEWSQSTMALSPDT
jgi:glucose-1-phosphate thymidylyltransferase